MLGAYTFLVGLLYLVIRPNSITEANEFTRTMVQLAGGLAVLGGAYFTWRNIAINEKNQRINEANQRINQRNLERSQREFIETQRNFEARLQQERAIADERARQEREQAERKLRQDEFTDILSRFANPDNLALRVNAVLRLSALARRPPLGVDLDPPRTRATYPLFVDALTQLATALRTETSPILLDSLITALEQLTNFAKESQSHRPRSVARH